MISAKAECAAIRGGIGKRTENAVLARAEIEGSMSNHSEVLTELVAHLPVEGQEFTLEFLLYRELFDRLNNSRFAFEYFCTKSIAIHGRELYGTGGMCKYPGWQEFVTEFAFPLNEKIENVIRKIKAFLDTKVRSLPYDLQNFLSYIRAWRILHNAWENGENDTYNWTAGRNFPSGLDAYVESTLVDLLKSPDVQLLLKRW